MNPYFIGGTISVFALVTGLAFVQTKRLDACKQEFATFKAQVETAQKLHDAKDAQLAHESKVLIKGKDDEREKLLADSGNAWAAELSRVRGERDRLARQGSEPASGPPKVCDNADGNNRLSDAIQEAERGYRATFADYRIEAGRLLEVAQRQAIEWNNLKSAVSGIRQVNVPETLK